MVIFADMDIREAHNRKLKDLEYCAYIRSQYPDVTENSRSRQRFLAGLVDNDPAASIAELRTPDKETGLAFTEALELLTKLGFRTDAPAVAAVVRHLLTWEHADEGALERLSRTLFEEMVRIDNVEAVRVLFDEGLPIQAAISRAHWWALKAAPNVLRLLYDSGGVELTAHLIETHKLLPSGFPRAGPSCSRELTYFADDVWATPCVWHELSPNGETLQVVSVEKNLIPGRTYATYKCPQIKYAAIPCPRGRDDYKPGDIVEQPGFVDEYDAAGFSCGPTIEIGGIYPLPPNCLWRVRLALPGEGDPSIPCSLRQDRLTGNCSALKLVLLERSTTPQI